MNKKDLLAPIAIISLSIVFAIICIAVFFTKGKSDFWISKKFKIGALLLSFTTLIACKPLVMCYDVASTECYFSVDDEYYKEGNYFIDLKVNDTLKGTVYYVENENSEFEYNIADTSNNVVQQGKIIAEDGIFDSINERYFFKISDEILTGNYSLTFSHKDSTEINSINIQIEN